MCWARWHRVVTISIYFNVLFFKFLIFLNYNLRSIKIHATSNLQETVSILSLPDRSGVKSIDWSADGQLLAVSTNQGAVTVFVTKLHTLFAVSPPRIALLTSLAEVSLFSYTVDKVSLPREEKQVAFL